MSHTGPMYLPPLSNPTNWIGFFLPVKSAKGIQRSDPKFVFIITFIVDYGDAQNFSAEFVTTITTGGRGIFFPIGSNNNFII